MSEWVDALLTVTNDRVEFHSDNECFESDDCQLVSRLPSLPIFGVISTYNLSNVLLILVEIALLLYFLFSSLSEMYHRFHIVHSLIIQRLISINFLINYSFPIVTDICCCSSDTQTWPLTIISIYSPHKRQK